MAPTNAEIEKPTGTGLILEAWSQGYMIGSLVIMSAITVSNMRRKVLLHKLILIELIFGMFQGTFIFPNPPVYGYYEAVAAVFLNTSWIMHNIIAWIKNKPFLGRKVSYIYIGTVLLSIPYWIVEMYANFTFYNNINDLFTKTRPYEAIFRDPWWVFTTCNLFYNIKRRYEFSMVEIIRVSPRFGVLLGAMVLSVCFIILDILSVTSVLRDHLPEGLNPFWKLAFVFKCLTDTIILDDFKTALDRLKQYKLERLGTAATLSLGSDDNPRPNMRRETTAPYNESRGVTSSEKPNVEHRDMARPIMCSGGKKDGDDEFSHIDLEMSYWTAENGEGSRSTGG